jgi:NAD(P)-dependent dehydrogenase (short-subunit alcohol dehydrogenase family)
MQIEGAVAVVFGGGGGFGGATARRLHAAGATVVVAEFDEDKGQAVADELGARAIFVAADASNEVSVQAVFEQAEALGPVRISVDAHGGGGGHGRTLDKRNQPFAQEGFNSTITIYLEAVYNVLRLAAASIAKSAPLVDGERGVIINTASIAGYEGTIGQTAYGAAKAGVIGMTLPGARDLGPLGIRVCTIAPGAFLTPAFAHADPVEIDKMWGAAVPFPKRMGRPSEYAQLAQAIAENVYLNGEVIRLDGGLRFTPHGAT